MKGRGRRGREGGEGEREREGKGRRRREEEKGEERREAGKKQKGGERRGREGGRRRRGGKRRWCGGWRGGEGGRIRGGRAVRGDPGGEHLRGGARSGRPTRSPGGEISGFGGHRSSNRGDEVVVGPLPRREAAAGEHGHRPQPGNEQLDVGGRRATSSRQLGSSGGARCADGKAGCELRPRRQSRPQARGSRDNIACSPGTA